MPTVLRASGYQFIIFTSDHPPAHIHVRGQGKLAKIRLEPVEFERTGGFNAGEQSKILQIVRDNVDLLLNAWNEIFSLEEDTDE
jgi:hypothetical protein